MDVRSRRLTAGVMSIAVTGEIDMATVGELTRALRAAVLDAKTTDVVVDFAGVSFCDSSGLAALDAAFGEGARRGTAVRLVNLQPEVRRLLEIVGMLDALVQDPGR